MEKLTIEYLAPYLPYKLKISFDQILIELVGIVDKGEGEYMADPFIIDLFGNEYYFDNCKPVLRNLSDLTKEIEINGKRFVPLNELSPYSTSRIDMDDWNKTTDDIPYCDIKKLARWHFDLNNLIEKGLAIDINTIELQAKKDIKNIEKIRNLINSIINDGNMEIG